MYKSIISDHTKKYIDIIIEPYKNVLQNIISIKKKFYGIKLPYIAYPFHFFHNPEEMKRRNM